MRVQAALLFNLGAVATQEALTYDTSTDAGLKAAAKRFQVLRRYLLSSDWPRAKRPTVVLRRGVSV